MRRGQRDRHDEEQRRDAEPHLQRDRGEQRLECKPDGSRQGCTQARGPHQRYQSCCREREHTVQQRMNPAGEAIGALLGFHTFFGGAGAPAAVHVFGNAGVTHRDVAVLGLAAAAGASCTMAELRAVLDFVPAEAIVTTVARLAARGFVTRSGDSVVLSLKGYVVSMPGPAAG